MQLISYDQRDCSGRIARPEWESNGLCSSVSTKTQVQHTISKLIKRQCKANENKLRVYEQSINFKKPYQCYNLIEKKSNALVFKHLKLESLAFYKSSNEKKKRFN